LQELLWLETLSSRQFRQQKEQAKKNEPHFKVTR
jgi:hypothetical protein